MSTRVITSVGEHTQHYTGKGYQYFFYSDKSKGRSCKLQCPKRFLETFEVAKGRCNTFGLPHLQVLDQGNGWWIITSDQPENDGVVVEFIAKFNRWRLKEDPPDGEAKPKRRYTIQAKAHVHPGQIKAKGRQQPTQTPTNKLELLAQTINARYGHIKA